MKNAKNIAISGASSGLGRALALHYAGQGVALYLHGRNATRLEETAQKTRAKGATAEIYAGDITDVEGVKAWLAKADASSPLDLVIANAGISAGSFGGEESEAQARAIFAANIDGVMNTVQPALALMRPRRKGQIAIISSLAGIRGLPSCPAYSASKNCVRAYGEALRGMVAEDGVEVNVVCPGYVYTNMTAANDFPMPFIMSAEKAANIIASGLAKNKARIAFPKRLYWPMYLITCLPAALTDPLFSRLPAKKAMPHGQ